MGESVVEQVKENIYRLGVTLPQNPLRELNSYLIRGGERDLLIDTGFRRPECREALMAGITEAGSSTSRIDVLLTHLHSDHTGLAREAAAPDGRIYISETDFKVLQEGFLPQRSLLRHRQFLEAGFPEELLNVQRRLIRRPAISWMRWTDAFARCVKVIRSRPAHTVLR